MKKKIVITGITSEIMQKLVSLIDFSEYEVIGISRFANTVQLNNVKIIPGDICDTDSFAHSLKDCYMIIHAAAVTHSFKSEKYYRVNLDATKKIVDIAKECDVKKFVFISSNTAGTESGTYGLTKYLAEEYLQEHLNCWLIIRLSEVYGGDRLEGIEKLINSVMEKRVVLCPLDVPSKFLPIYIDDAVQKIYNYTFRAESFNKTKIINGQKELSFQDIIRLTSVVTKKRIRIIFVKRKVMFFIMKLAQMVPFYIGVTPDQIARLYSKKCFEKSDDIVMDIETYIMNLVEKKNLSAMKVEKR